MPSGLKGYNIRLDGAKMNNAPVAELGGFQLTGLSSSTDYSSRITVTAVDNAGNESAPVSLADIEVSAVTHDPAPEGVELPLSVRTAIDGFVAERLKPHTKTDGCVLGIKTPDGSYYKAYGGDRGKTLTLDDKMRYGSISKMWCSLLIIKQIDEGHLSLTDTVDMYIDGIPNGDKITVLNLLVSNSGLKDYLQQDPAVQQQYFLNPTSTFDTMAYIRSTPPIFEPGGTAPPGSGNGTYSNSNWVLQARILEVLDAEYGTGRDYRTIILEDSVEALGLESVEWPPIGVNYMTPPYSRGWMINAALPVIQSILGPFAFLAGLLGYPTTEEIEFTAVSTSFPDAAGALDGTVADLVKFGEAVVSGALISPEMFELRNEIFVPYLTYEPVNAWDGPGWMGFGMGVIAWGDWFGWLGSLGGYQSVMLANMVNGAVVALICNHAQAASGDLAFRICYELYPESTLTLPTFKIRPTTIASTAVVNEPGVYVYHDPTSQIPTDDVPFYI